ncbi:MAG: glycosyltransferase family 2 protein [Gammaproteobacteria bacterium]|nr:glycosyltransferase family 2 protein [Gammaproteobacteria bacterium]
MSEADPLLTIIITVFNQQHFVQRALQSCYLQQVENLEILLIDDGSEPAICLPNDLVPNGVRLRLLRQANGGVASARNFGIKQARGRFIKFLDCDDELLADCCSAQLSSMAFDRARLSIIGYRVVQGARWVEGVPKFDQLFTALLQGNVAPLHAFMYRTSDVLAIGGFDESERTRAAMEDYDFHLRLAMFGVSAVTVHQCGVVYHRQKLSRSSNNNIVHQANIRILLNAVDHFLAVDTADSGNYVGSTWSKPDAYEAILTGIVQQAVQSNDYQNFLPILQKLRQLNGAFESISSYQLQLQAHSRQALTVDVNQQQFWQLVLNILPKLSVPVDRMSQPGYWFRPQSPALAGHFFDGILLAKAISQASQSQGLWLWGTGVWGDYWLTMLAAVNKTPLGFIDSYAEPNDTYKSLPCLRPESVPKEQLHHIIICSRDSYMTIADWLNARNMGQHVLHYVTL